MWNDDLKTAIIKTIAMLSIVAAEWWMMQPYHEPIIPKFWHTLAQFCYRLARKLGEAGITCEHYYWEAV